MNWRWLRVAPWLDTRARFVASLPHGASLLDIGSSDGETLRHIAELRPDLRLFSTDIAGDPAHYPPGCQFHRGDIQRERLPWPDESMDGISCMHVVEHLADLGDFFNEARRLLRRGGRIYIETPHPKTVALPKIGKNSSVTFTMNFYDDETHVRPIPVEEMIREAGRVGLDPVGSGISRNWIFAGLWPFYYFHRPSRQKYTACAHWLGWSAYLLAEKPR
jgi:SAM-dependent methyltransferase